uniref:NADH-ubiquinone oxidoreductase chain 5 n=1 Tax=Orthocis pygmaeus TaxID=433259 RepID=A0A343C515_9CUCU|nr:NADH dehydrogenase subunit 5 [Orthocis pygmaeus]
MLKTWLKWFFFFLYMSIFSFFFSIYFLINGIIYFLEFDLLMVNCSKIVMTFYFDWMTLMFMSFVYYISSMVIFYSSDYMIGDLNVDRFYLLVVMFVFSMMLLIISPNLISILLGWDGLGLVSYCLVIYYQNLKSFNAGMLTALSNRVGDVALLISISWMLNYGGWNYIFFMYEFNNDFYMILISLLVVLAAMTKSAQIPFSSWLPAAMAAPTPVSSLVHSSTLVTAGVYLLIRFSPCISDFVMSYLLFISLMTMFMAGLCANFEYDLKKIIALSTLSQLGLMMGILALGGYELAFFHLLVHALFKALLFMSSGMLIHSFMNFQDVRFMGSLINKMPLTCSFMNISNLSLCGLPFLSGFYSKDFVVEFMEMGYLNLFTFFLFFISIGLTVCYSFRLVYYLNLNSINFLGINMFGESSINMILGMSGLGLMVIFMGSLMMWIVFDVPYLILLPFNLKVLTLLIIFMGIFIGLEFSKFGISYLNKGMFMYNFCNFVGLMWFMPLMFTYGINNYPILLGEKQFLSVDQGWSEYLGSRKIWFLLKDTSVFNYFVFINNIKVYFLLMLFLMIFIVLF